MEQRLQQVGQSMARVKVAVSILILLFEASSFAAGVSSSKANGYAVTGPPSGVSSSKVNTYIVTGSPKGVGSSKVNTYAVIGPLGGVSAAKANIYVVIMPIKRKQPSAYITTSLDRKHRGKFSAGENHETQTE